MNLGESAARKAPNSGWVRETVDVITSVQKRFSVGKGWEDPMACGGSVAREPFDPSCGQKRDLRLTPPR